MLIKLAVIELQYSGVPCQHSVPAALYNMQSRPTSGYLLLRTRVLFCGTLIVWYNNWDMATFFCNPNFKIKLKCNAS